jgi:carbon-monoxide dehydrogenase medium subunit
MIPARTEYVRADSAEQALQLLAQHGEEARLLAGGQSLIPLLKLRLATPSVLIDIGRISELRYIRLEGDEVAVGALTRDHDLQTSAMLHTEIPLLAYVAAQVGDPQVRARGTVGGTLAHGDAASDLPTAVLALGGTMVISGPGGTRTVAATEFFKGTFSTAIEPDEMLVEVRLPRLAGHGWGYQKFTRRANDWPIAAVAAVDGRVALANAAETVIRARATEEAIAAGASISDAAQVADREATPAADMHGSITYHRHLIRVLTKRALHAAAA